MNTASINPEENRLPDGLSAALLEAAVAASGYPLQTIVASQLRARRYNITEEWAFQDKETGQLRTLDILASLDLYDAKDTHRYVRPGLDLLIECKQSTMPYVFFASETRPGLGGSAMRVVGLRRDEITVTTDDDPSTWSFSTIQALSLADHTFVAEPLSVALAFSKAAWRNKEVVLSGADPYQSLMLPLTKALDDHAARAAPVATAVYFDAVLPAAIAVIDGPMVVATVKPDCVTYELSPWVRVYRHDVDREAGHRFARNRLHAVDCVHAAWLSEYLAAHLEPFAAEYGRRALAHHKEVATGSAFASQMGSDSFEGVKNRLRPRELRHKARRSAGIVKGIADAARAGASHLNRRIRPG